MVSPRHLYIAVKPGIIYGNLLHYAAGGLLAFASGLSLSVQAFLYGAAGTILVIAAACLVNNYYDRDIDARMARTKRRPTVDGRLSGRELAGWATLFLAVGMGLLMTMVSMQVAVIGLLAFVAYAGVYTVAKHKTPYSTIIGAFPGAIPAVAGYVAMTGRIDMVALSIGLLIFAWQMPHFYAIALFRKAEYQAAGVPVISTVLSAAIVRRKMLVWMTLYLLAAIVLCWFSNGTVFEFARYASYASLLIAAGAVWWLSIGLRPYDAAWAKRVFHASLLLSVLFLLAGILTALIYFFTRPENVSVI